MFSFSCPKERKKEVPFSMTIGNGELMQECFPKHSRMDQQEWHKTKRQNTDEESKEGGMSMERSKADTKERCPDGLPLHNKLQY